MENCVDFCPKVKLTKVFLKKGKKAEKMENRKGNVKMITLCIILRCKAWNSHEDLQALRAVQIVAGLSTHYRNNYQLLLLICAKHKPELVFESGHPYKKKKTPHRGVFFFLELVAGLEERDRRVIS